MSRLQHEMNANKMYIVIHRIKQYNIDQIIALN